MACRGRRRVPSQPDREDPARLYQALQEVALLLGAAGHAVQLIPTERFGRAAADDRSAAAVEEPTALARALLAEVTHVAQYVGVFACPLKKVH